MDFRPTDDQRLLADGVAEFLAGECAPDAVRATWEAGRFDPARWKALAGLGVTGLTVPTDHGGLGMDERDLVGVLVEAGRAALPEPVLEVTAVAAPLLTDLGGELAATWLPRIAAGEAVVVPVLPEDPYPAHAEAADLLLVVDGDDLFALPPGEAEVVAQPNVDGARPTARVTVAAGRAPDVSGPEVHRATARATARARTAAAAVLVGLGHATIDRAVGHARQREQFGRPIGSFQAVKHRLASALVDVQFARPLVERAAHTLAVGEDAAVDAAMAKAFATEAADAAARHALQVHGAIGYTWECDLHLFMKRVWSLSAAFGGLEDHWAQVEDAVLVSG